MHRVVEQLDVIEHVLSGFLAGFVGAAPDALTLKRGEEAHCARFWPRDLFDIMSAVESLGSFHDGWSGPIAACLPGTRINRRSAMQLANILDCGAKPSGIDAQWAGEAVFIPAQRLDLRIRRVTGHQDRHDRGRVGGFMKMFEVETIAIDLVQT